MAFYVYAPDGKRYGPADLTMLQQWVGEGRILPQTMLEDDTNGQHINASGVPGLSFPQAAPTYDSPPNLGGPHAGYQNPSLGHTYSQNPYPNQNQPSNYYRPGGPTNNNAGSQDITMAWVFSALQLVCCLPLSIVGLVYASKARRAGVPGAQAAYVFSIVMVSLWGLMALVQFLAVLAGGLN